MLNAFPSEDSNARHSIVPIDVLCRATPRGRLRVSAASANEQVQRQARLQHNEGSDQNSTLHFQFYETTCIGSCGRHRTGQPNRAGALFLRCPWKSQNANRDCSIISQHTFLRRTFRQAFKHFASGHVRAKEPAHARLHTSPAANDTTPEGPSC